MKNPSCGEKEDRDEVTNSRVVTSLLNEKGAERERTVVEVTPAEAKFCNGGSISSDVEMTSLK